MIHGVPIVVLLPSTDCYPLPFLRGWMNWTSVDEVKGDEESFE